LSICLLLYSCRWVVQIIFLYNLFVFPANIGVGNLTDISYQPFKEDAKVNCLLWIIVKISSYLRIRTLLRLIVKKVRIAHVYRLLSLKRKAL
jgi:hypothetical protein